MNKSESIAKLAGALAKAQSQMEPAKKDTKGNFGKFADLGEVIDTIRKVAAPNGLSFSQFPVGDSAGVGVSTILMHESGEWLSETIYLPVSEDMAKRNGAQNAGSNITYLRRYALAAAFGVYADEDTDGQQPQRTPQLVTKSTATAAVNIPDLPEKVHVPSHENGNGKHKAAVLKTARFPELVTRAVQAGYVDEKTANYRLVNVAGAAGFAEITDKNIGQVWIAISKHYEDKRAAQDQTEPEPQPA